MCQDQRSTCKQTGAHTALEVSWNAKTTAELFQHGKRAHVHIKLPLQFDAVKLSTIPSGERTELLNILFSVVNRKAVNVLLY